MQCRCIDLWIRTVISEEGCSADALICGYVLSFREKATVHLLNVCDLQCIFWRKRQCICINSGTSNAFQVETGIADASI